MSPLHLVHKHEVFTGLTVTLFPKAGLLRWNEEEQEAEEYRDRGVSAVAFPSKEIHMAERREVGLLERTGCGDTAPLRTTQSSSDSNFCQLLGAALADSWTEVLSGDRSTVWGQPP